MASFSYDVFLSFRGKDTRMGITGHLYDALSQRGIRTFMDDEELRIGEELTPALVKAIQKSRAAIVVFSRNYAYSRWCLEELVTILDCYKEKKVRLVLPVFYDVDPSYVRYQRGSYGEALALHEERFKDNMDKVNKWRMALHHAANLSGFHFNLGDGYEFEFVARIVEEISRKINNRVPLRVADYPVGLESRMLEVMSLLDVGSDDVVRMVGIFGFGGIGKTTIAQAVYNSISDHFEGLCFLENVRENSAKHGLVHLQEIVLYKILGDKHIKLQNVNQGISIIKQRFHRKKVLLVLDDVDKTEQLEAIVGGVDWFGSGSRVIITTRNKHLLILHMVERTYEVKELNEKEAFDLFTWYAFKTDKVDPRYADVLKHAISYASGLPLALEVIGSQLFGKRIEEWECALDQYRRVPDGMIQKILKLSYDSLVEVEKEIFLDIACFFNGHELASVEDILYAHHGLSMKYSMEVLIDKSLIKIDDGLLRLHDLIRDMGREIVKQESPNEPGKRSRLWFFEDVVQVLEENTGSSEIESLFLDFPKHEAHSNGPKCEEVYWDGEALKKMENLKTLIIRNGHFNKGPTHLPHSLRVLKWCGYPSPSLPSDFHPKKLAILELPDGCLRTSEQIQGFMCLTVLDLNYCAWILRIPDVSGLPNLAKLSFKHCESLIQIHESVGLLDKLRILDAVGCKKLRTFPPIRMSSLEQLNLSHCSNLESFPEILGKMENIRELHITGSPIKELPFSIQNLTRLRKLELQLCGMIQLPSSIVMLPELGLMCVSQCEGLQLSTLDRSGELESKSSNTECLILSHCNISDDFLPLGLTWFANVKDLNLSGNNFTILHACIKGCHFLRSLKLDDCRFLRDIGWIPMKLETLSMKGCTSLKCLDLTVLHAHSGKYHFLKELILDDCVYLQEIMGVLPNLDHFSAKNCTSLASSCICMLLNQESVEAGNKMFIFPGTKIPEWFTHRSRGGSLSFWFRNKFPVISLCFVIGLVDEQSTVVKFSPTVFINGNKQFRASQKIYEFRIATDHIFLFNLQLLKFEDNMDEAFSENEWNHVEVSYADHITKDGVAINLVAKQIGIHILNKMSSMEDILFIKPDREKRKSPPYCKKRKSDDFFLTRESMEGPRQRVRTIATRPLKALTTVPCSPILTLTQPSPATAEKVQASLPTPSFERPWDDISGETSERLQEDEVHPTAIQNDLLVNEEGIGSYDINDIKQAAMLFGKLESEESSSNSNGSDSDDPFDQVNVELSVSGKQVLSYGESSGDASLTSIREAIDAFELVMVKDISEVSSDLATQSRLDQLLDLLSSSSHPQVTLEVKEALVEFKKKAFSSFQEFQATVESVKKLKVFETLKARIQKETAAGKDRRKDLKNSIKKATLAIKSESSRKEELSAEIATLRKQLATKERDLEQLELNVKNQEAALLTYSTNRASLDEEAQALLKEATDLVAANTGVKDEGENAEIIQNRLKSTWSADLTGQFIQIRKKILGRYE